MNLDHFLENNVKKTLNSKVVYNNLEEAEKYCKKEQDGESTSQWTFVECEPEDPNNNTVRARVLHDNKTSDTIYTFSSSCKIYIEMILEKIIRKGICDCENSFSSINQLNLLLHIARKNLIISLESKTNTDLQGKLF